MSTQAVVSLNLTGDPQPLFEVVTAESMSRLDAWKRFAEVLRVLAVEHPNVLRVLREQGFEVREVGILALETP